MRPGYRAIVTVLSAAGLVVAGCSGGTGKSPATQSSAPPASDSSPAAQNGAPKVQNPLPAKVLEGSPCDTSLSADDVKEFIGAPDPAKPDNSAALGASCSWHNAAGNGASIDVGYQTKLKGGLGAAYSNVKPDAVRWVEPSPIQGYPLVGYLSANSNGLEKSECVLVVGISDDLTYSVGLFLSDSAKRKNIDPCTAGRDVADRVLTRIKTRA
ncbi:DUF3558 domain-containing protein [Amycolatopsis sp. NPDC059027]|uniref:DUF3558 domain-containing protein n=1 Tax=Amycolatopsis sp. NPDC059027 TaxID=3346709 RepID=UPI00366EECAA